MEDFRNDRTKFYKKISRFWHDLYGAEYALFDVSVITPSELADIKQCTQRTGAIFFKVCELLRNADDTTLLEMGFPYETLAFIRLKTTPAESIIARLDLIKTDHTYKCIEINADTPTFIKELFHVNGFITKEFGFDDPNEGLHIQLAAAVRAAVAHAGKVSNSVEPYVVFTAHADNIEDKNTALYLQELYGLPAKFVPLDLLTIDPAIGLFDEDGRKIDILYRQTFPIESMIEDEDKSGNKIGLWLLELVQAGKLAILNPPSSFLLQNKAVMAVIWGLHENADPFFTETEHMWIENYFLPTYLEPEPFLDSATSFVKKPIFGREGDTVQIYNESGGLLIDEPQKNYFDIPAIYQKYTKLPMTQFRSVHGLQKGYQLIGSFLVNGQASAIGFRVGGEITNNLSCFLPAGIARE